MRDYAGNHMSITRLNIKKASREQVESNMELTLDKNNGSYQKSVEER